MKNKKDLTSHCDPYYAGLLAGHLVGQVIDEAYIIAHTVLESGQPWHYQRMSANFSSTSQFINPDDETSFLVLNGDSNVNDNKIKHNVIVTTSTPQKLPDEAKTKGESNFIGQGDEELEGHSENTEFSSMFINQLFDMSDVERVFVCDDSDIGDPHLTVSNDSLTKTARISKLMDSYANLPIGMDSGVDIKATTYTTSDKSLKSSEYLYLADACISEVNDAYPITIDKSNMVEDLKSTLISTSPELQQITDKTRQERKEIIVDPYENTFLTLNRDTEDDSEDNREPFLQDLKDLSLHEVELLTANTSEENLCARKIEKEKNKLISSIDSASASVSRESTLKRCRIRGVKLLSCFKGWWRRKPPVNNKDVLLGSKEEMFPPSPNARRRPSSLLENGTYRTASSSRPII